MTLFMKKPYKYLLWDIDGTLLDFKAAEYLAIKHLFYVHGLGECTDSMLEHYSAINRRYWEALERKEMTKKEILLGRFMEFFALYGLDTSVAEQFNADYQIALGDHIIFTEDAMEVMQELKGKYVLVAVTNGTKVAQERKLAKSGLDRLFDYVFISEDVGAEKPDPEFFDHVFRDMGIRDASEVLIIGDSLTSDIRGGCNAGIDTCWYNPSGARNTAVDVRVNYEVQRLREVLALV